MRIGPPPSGAAQSPHIYNLLDQRLSQQGVVLHQLMKDYAASTTGGGAVGKATPTSEEQNVEQAIKTYG